MKWGLDSQCAFVIGIGSIPSGVDAKKDYIVYCIRLSLLPAETGKYTGTFFDAVIFFFRSYGVLRDFGFFPLNIIFIFKQGIFTGRHTLIFVNFHNVNFIALRYRPVHVEQLENIKINGRSG